MKKNVSEHNPQIIEEVSNLLQISPAVVEKDIFVTQALYALSDLKDIFFQLVFQGGTCLSKAYSLIQRMSEDCDFRITSNDLVKKLSKAEYRRQLRRFRRKIVTALEQNGFTINHEKIRIDNSGQYMDMSIDYDTKFPLSAALRPQIKLEFIALNTKVLPATKVITSLIQQTLKDETYDLAKALLCANVTETAADKWVAFTRRAATIARGYRKHDNTLVRHLYDLYMLDQQQVLDKRFHLLATDIMIDDQQQYKMHSLDYANDPIQETQFILEELEQKPIWREDWQNFTSAMVFQGKAPDFDDALKTLNRLSEEIIRVSKTVSNNPMLTVTARTFDRKI